MAVDMCVCLCAVLTGLACCMACVGYTYWLGMLYVVCVGYNYYYVMLHGVWVTLTGLACCTVCVGYTYWFGMLYGVCRLHLLVWHVARCV